MAPSSTRARSAEPARRVPAPRATGPRSRNVDQRRGHLDVAVAAPGQSPPPGSSRTTTERARARPECPLWSDGGARPSTAARWNGQPPHATTTPPSTRPVHAAAADSAAPGPCEHDQHDGGQVAAHAAPAGRSPTRPASRRSSGWPCSRATPQWRPVSAARPSAECSTRAVPVAKFTDATTPSSRLSLRSMRLAQVAQVMPPIVRSTVDGHRWLARRVARLVDRRPTRRPAAAPPRWSPSTPPRGQVDRHVRHAVQPGQLAGHRLHAVAAGHADDGGSGLHDIDTPWLVTTGPAGDGVGGFLDLLGRVAGAAGLDHAVGQVALEQARARPPAAPWWRPRSGSARRCSRCPPRPSGARPEPGPRSGATVRAGPASPRRTSTSGGLPSCLPRYPPRV